MFSSPAGSLFNPMTAFGRHSCLPPLVLTCTMLLSSVGTAQVATDAVLQLDMLDTPTDDLVRLATTYTDALRDLKSARLSIETVQRLRPSAVVTNLEVQIAQVNLEAAERKLTILRMIAEKQLKAAQNKLAIVNYLEGLGSPLGEPAEPESRHDFVRLNDEATIEILKAILALN